MKTLGSPGVVTCLQKVDFRLNVNLNLKFKDFFMFVSFPNVPDMWEPKPPKGFVSPKGEKKSITEPLFFFDFPGKFRLAFE